MMFISAANSGPLFNRNELPQPSPDASTPLAEIAGLAIERVPFRANALPRLAVTVGKDTGSGVIDLDAVARALERDPGAGHWSTAAALVASAPKHTGAPVEPTIAPATSPRSLLYTSIVLLGVVASMLGYVVTT